MAQMTGWFQTKPQMTSWYMLIDNEIHIDSHQMKQVTLIWMLNQTWITMHSTIQHKLVMERLGLWAQCITLYSLSQTLTRMSEHCKLKISTAQVVLLNWSFSFQHRASKEIMPPKKQQMSVTCLNDFRNSLQDVSTMNLVLKMLHSLAP